MFHGMSRLLLVDDDPVSLKMIGKPLTALGHDITESCDGVEAIDAIDKDSEYDLVITDLTMPNHGWA